MSFQKVLNRKQGPNTLAQVCQIKIGVGPGGCPLPFASILLHKVEIQSGHYLRVKDWRKDTNSLLKQKTVKWDVRAAKNRTNSQKQRKSSKWTMHIRYEHACKVKNSL